MKFPPPTAGASSFTPKIRPGVNHEARLVAGANAVVLAVKLDGKPDDRPDDNQNFESDDDEDAEVDAATDKSRDQENANTDPETNTDAAGSAQENDMWKLAEAQLRLDKKQGELLDAYYDILTSQMKKHPNPAGSPEGQKQIAAFIESEYEGFHDTSKCGKFAGVLIKGADCILKAQSVISAASQSCLYASVACAGVMLVVRWEDLIEE